MGAPVVVRRHETRFSTRPELGGASYASLSERVVDVFFVRGGGARGGRGGGDRVADWTGSEGETVFLLDLTRIERVKRGPSFCLSGSRSDEACWVVAVAGLGE